MTKKFITGLLALTLMLGVVPATSSFADDAEAATDTNPKVEKRVDRNGEQKGGLFGFEKLGKEQKPEKIDGLKEFKSDKKSMDPEKREEVKNQLQEKRAETLNNLYPEIVEEHDALLTDKKEVRDDIRALKDQMDEITGFDKEAVKEEAKAYFDELKAKFESGEITKEEAKTLLSEFKETQKDKHESLSILSDTQKAELEAIRTEYDSLRDQREAASKDVKSAVEANDSEAFKAAFDKVMDIIKQELSIETQKYEILKAAVDNASN